MVHLMDPEFLNQPSATCSGPPCDREVLRACLSVDLLCAISLAFSDRIETSGLCDVGVAA